MGCDTGQDNEQPVHGVWIDEFLLAAHQVTNADYGRFLRESASPSQPPFWTDPAFNHPDQPVVGVSWYEAIRYCEWLSKSTGRNFACRPKPNGSAPREEVSKSLVSLGRHASAVLPGYAIRCAVYWQKGAEPVARAEPNAYGLYNMCDNVHEWCSDWFAPDYYAVSPERNPRGPEAGVRRASRGGSGGTTSRCRAARRVPASHPSFITPDYGFRVACDYNGRSEVRG